MSSRWCSTLVPNIAPSTRNRILRLKACRAAHYHDGVSDSADGDGSRGGPSDPVSDPPAAPPPPAGAADPDRAPAPAGAETEARAGAVDSGGVPFETTVPPTRRQSTAGL